jgi:beta-lactamase regulating signal transducer with metallopeptidase domain
MNPLTAFAGNELWHIAGWTMLHYLWIGALVGVLAVVCRLLLRRSSANIRYAAACACLLLLVALPPAIVSWLAANSPRLNGEAIGGNLDLTESTDRYSFTTQQPGESSRIDLALTSPPLKQEATGVSENVEAPTVNTSASEQNETTIQLPKPSQVENQITLATLERYIPYLPWLWIIGTPITFALLAAGIIGTRRLRIASRAIDDPRIVDVLKRLTTSLRITQHVTVAICERIASPVLIGIVRPIILLPPAALTGWSPDEIEMVLLHELAHVRRWDNFVNLAQRFIESLLFFHPAVWLVSAWIRRERESCCDAFVVSRTDRPHAYAELLVALAAQMPRSVLFHPAASSAMSAGPLRSRIRRILQLDDDPMLVSGKTLTAFLAALLLAGACALLYVPSTGHAEEQKPSDAAPKSNEPASASEPTSTGEVDAATGLQDTYREVEQNRYGAPEPTTDHDAKPIIQRFPASYSQDLLTKSINAVIESRPERGLHVLVAFPPTIPAGVELAVAKSILAKHGKDKVAGVTHAWISGDEVEVTVSTKKPQSDAPTSFSRARFPSLEEQKLADFIWKRLGVEMQPIDENDLKRVQAFGYDGGLKVTAGAAGLQGSGSHIQPHDILVGLHVWPATSMEGVAKILQRDDLSELNPFKFYVVRPILTAEGQSLTSQDAVVTGRVSVNLLASASPSPPATITSGTVQPPSNPYSPSPSLQPSSPPATASAPRSVTKQNTAPTHSTPNSIQLTSSDRVVEAYTIPPELKDAVRDHERQSDLRGVWDDSGLFLLQATPERHQQFKQLLEATPKWRESLKKIVDGDWRSALLSVDKVDGTDVLEWPVLGLSFVDKKVIFPNSANAAEHVVVTVVAPGSPGAWQDVQPGDILTSVDLFDVANLAELASVVKALRGSTADDGWQVQLKFIRNSPHGQMGKPTTFQLDPDRPSNLPPEVREQLNLQSRRQPVAEKSRKAPTPLDKDPTPADGPAAPPRPGASKTSTSSPLASTDGLAALAASSTTAPTSASSNESVPEAEIAILKEQVELLKKQFDRVNALLMQAAPGGTVRERESVSSELTSAKGELAQAQGDRETALSLYQDAVKHAEQAIAAAKAAHAAGQTDEGDILRATQNLLNIKRKLLRAQNQAPAAPAIGWPAAADQNVPIPPSEATPQTSSAPVSTYDPSTGARVYSSSLEPTPSDDTKPKSFGTIAETAREFPWFLAVFYSPNDPFSLEERKELLTELGKHFDDSRMGIALIDVTFHGKEATKYDVKHTPTYWIFHNGKTVVRITGKQSTKDLIQAIETAKSRARDRQASKAAASSPASTPTVAPTPHKSALRYEGKSFDEWRSQWQTELSIEKRIDAIKALAAFGAHGYADEAAETILDVYSQYEPGFGNSDSPEGLLRRAVASALVGKIPADTWRPLLHNRFEDDAEKWQWLAVETLPKVKPTSDESRQQMQEFLLKLTRSDESSVSYAAVSALIRLDPNLANNDVKTLVLAGLSSDDRGLVVRTVDDLSRSPQYPPELVEMLLRGEQPRQQLIRQALARTGSFKANRDLGEKLAAILGDEKQSDVHLAAIRALAAARRAAEDVESPIVETLREIAEDSKSLHQVAAAVAVSELTRGQVGAAPLLIGRIIDSSGNETRVELDPSVIQDLLQQERQEIFGNELLRR